MEECDIPEPSDQPLTSDEMLAAARREVIGDQSPSEQMVEEAKKTFETERPDSFTEAMAEAARERRARAEVASLELRFEEARPSQPSEPQPTLTRHRTGPRRRRVETTAPVPQDPFERKPRRSRRLRRLIPLAIVAFIVINSLLDQDIGSYLQELWNEIFGEGSGSLN